MSFGRSEALSAAGISLSWAVPTPACSSRSFRQAPHQHVGTADLDFHLSLHLLDGETADYYRAIIDGLRSLGLRPDIQDDREIRWRSAGPCRGVQLRVELLCPVRSRAGRPERPAPATPAEANIGPSGEITALAVGFGHLVPEGTVLIERRVETHRGMLGYEFPVAGLTTRRKCSDSSVVCSTTSSRMPMLQDQLCMQTS